MAFQDFFIPRHNIIRNIELWKMKNNLSISGGCIFTAQTRTRKKVGEVGNVASSERRKEGVREGQPRERGKMCVIE